MRKSQVIIFAIGINDSRCDTKGNPQTPLDKFQENFNSLLKKAKERADKIVCFGLTKVIDRKILIYKGRPTKFFYTDVSVKKYDAEIEKACQNANVPFLKMHNLLEDSDLQEDGLHPNSQGHEKIFQRIKEFLLDEKIIESPESHS